MADIHKPDPASVGVTDAISESARRGFLREAVLVAAAIVAYFAIRNQTAGSPGAAFTNARRIVDVEEWLDIAWEEAIQASIVGSDVLVTLANWVYIWGHWPVILGTAIALYLFRRDSYFLLRNAIFISGAIGFLLFALVPVAPPRLVPGTGLVDTVTERSDAYRALQPPGLTNQYAAFPSLHLGWNVLVGIVLLLTTTHLAVRALAVAMPFAMGFAVIATANHFVLDVAAGLVVVLAGFAAALVLERRAAVATLDGGGSAARFELLRRRDAPVPRRAPGRQPSRRPEGGRAPRHRSRRG